MKTKFTQTTRTPKFLFVFFIVQLVTVLSLHFSDSNFDLTVFYIILPVTFILIFTKFDIEFSIEHLKYKMFPLNLYYKEIKWNETEKVEIVNIDALSDFLGWGLRWSKKYGKSYIFDSNFALFITLKNNKRITFSINEKEKIVHFFDENNINYIQN